MQIKNIFSVLLLATAFSCGTIRAMEGDEEGDSVVFVPEEVINGSGDATEGNNQPAKQIEDDVVLSDEDSDDSGIEVLELDPQAMHDVVEALLKNDNPVDATKPAASEEVKAAAPSADKSVNAATKSGCRVSRCPLFSNWKRTAGSFGLAAVIGAVYWKLNKNRKNGKQFHVPTGK